MQIEFKKYSHDKPLLNPPKIGQLYLCECMQFCSEGVVAAEYTKEGFVFSGHGNVDKYITGWVLLEL